MKPPPLKPALARAARARPAASPPPVLRPVKRRPGLRTWLLRLTMLAICAGSVGLLYWSLFVRLVPVIREGQADTIEMSRLSDEVEELRLRWDPDLVEETQSRYEAARELLFSAQEEIGRWETGLERDAGSWALEAGLTLQETARPGPDGQPFEHVQALLEVEPFLVVGLTNSPYQRVLGYVQTIVNSSKRVDLVELQVDGNSNSVQQARAVIEVLRGDLAPVDALGGEAGRK